jgi:hypothetical protein
MLVIVYKDTLCHETEIYNLRFLWFKAFWNVLRTKSYNFFDRGCYFQRSSVWEVDEYGLRYVLQATEKLEDVMY